MATKTTTQTARSKHYCFTINNPALEPQAQINQLQSISDYIVFQEELSDSGTTHYQGYLALKTKQRITALNKVQQAHWTVARDIQASIAYCQKEDTRVSGPYFYGTPPPCKGKRTDIDALYQTARDPTNSLMDIAEAHQGTYLRYYKAVQHVRQLPALDKPPMRTDLKVILLYGLPGTGKTRYCYEQDPNLYAVPMGKELWLDNYRGEKTILIDDFSGQLRLVDLLRMIDIYPVQMQVKGSFVYIHATTIYITANVLPSNWYNYTTRQDSERALQRRFTSLFKVNQNQPPVPMDWNGNPTILCNALLNGHKRKRDELDITNTKKRKQSPPIYCEVCESAPCLCKLFSLE